MSQTQNAPVAPDAPATGRFASWTTNPKADLLSGLVVALALIPEAISFSILAGVDPQVGLYASFSMAVVIAFAGGRSGMISAATGARALVIVDLVADNPENGLGLLFAATILAGVFQVVFGLLRVGKLMRFVPRSVMVGFVNALAILIFLAQVPDILLSEGDSSQLPLNLIFIAAGLGIIYGLPRITTAIPSPLVAIIVLAGIAMSTGLSLPTVEDKGDLPSALPWVALPEVPFTLETFWIILPFSLTLALVGLLESLLTASLLDDMTDTDSDKNVEAVGQGVANIATGFFGGMAGCAMIGQSMINHRTGGRGRLSTFAAGVFLLTLIIVLGDWVGRIPIAALVAVMIMVSVGTFDWRSVSLPTLKTNPRPETLIMAATVATTVFTHNLAYGVGVGVALSLLAFARPFARHVSDAVKVTSVLDPDNTERLYSVSGELFFASTDNLVHEFDYKNVDVERVEIDLSNARIWDTSAVAALDAVVAKFQQQGIDAELVGLNPHAALLHKNTTGKLSAH